MEGFQISLATNGRHLAAVRDLLTAYGNLRGQDPALGNFQEELASLPGAYGPPAGGLLLATVQKTPAGCVAFRPLSAEICEMKRLFVLPDFQGQQIGRRLVEVLLQEARTAGYHRMRLDTHPWMAAARSLYLDLGFREIDRYNDNPTPGIRFFERALTD